MFHYTLFEARHSNRFYALDTRSGRVNYVPIRKIAASPPGISGHIERNRCAVIRLYTWVSNERLRNFKQAIQILGLTYFVTEANVSPRLLLR